MNALPVYNDRYIKSKTRTYGDKICTSFGGINVPEDDVEYESFTVSSIDSLFLYENRYYPQVYLNNCTYNKIVDKQMMNYLGDKTFETDED